MTILQGKRCGQQERVPDRDRVAPGLGQIWGWEKRGEAAEPVEFTGRPGISQVFENGILSAYVSRLAASK